MPWHIGSHESCPVSKPHAVIKDSDGSLAGCHASEADAKKQMAALYAKEGQMMTSANSSAGVERRFTMIPVELRAKDELRIGGYAAVFNRLSDNLGGFVEKVQPGFFNDSRSRGWPDVLARYNHDDNMLLGTIGGGTLRLLIDDTGLDYEVDLPQARSDIAELVRRGDVRKSSFAFRTLEDEWSTTDQGFPLRSLMSGVLIDVAPVNRPAYPDATAGLRSLAEFVQADFEEVRSLAETNNLRKFFTRTDRPPAAKTFAPAARAAILARKQDPWAEA